MFFFLSSFAQMDKNQALARQYYSTGAYDKAAALYEELWKEDQSNYYYYNSLFNSLVRLNDYEKLEEIAKKQQKKFKDDIRYKVDLGYVYSLNNQSKKADDVFQNAIDDLTASESDIRNLASKFISYRKEDYAIKAYEKGNQLLKNDIKFAYELGNTYLRNNNAAKAVENWLLLVNDSEKQLSRVQNILSANISKEGLADELETQLYQAVQKNSSKDVYPELLVWLFTQQNDYESALVQAKALDRRKNEDGRRIISLAYNAVREGMYDAAIEAYEYVIDKGDGSAYYKKAKSELLNTRKLKVTTTPNFTDDDISLLKSAYTDYLDKFGRTAANASTLRELAHLEANYLHNLATAISTLEELIKTPGLKQTLKNEIKLDLGDYYILDGDVWESTLLYAQVDKDEKDSPLGEDARFRNARLSYFKGEFEWAQAQLTVLKGATTELIANDALDLSVFIMDNLGLDTTVIPMEMYARAELLGSQNKPAEALISLDSILTEYPGHVLSDDVLFKKAKIEFQQRNYEKALSYLEQILKDHGEDILADNAAFMAGDISQFYMNDEDKAQEYYKLIITDYSESVLVVEARKRYRTIRGDGV